MTWTFVWQLVVLELVTTLLVLLVITSFKGPNK